MAQQSTSGAGAVFDLPRAIENAMGELELLSELAELFCDSANAFLAQIAAAIDSRDGEALRRSAHNLKGAVSPFCAAAARAAALSMENLGKANDFAAAERARPDLELEVARLREALRDLLLTPGG